MTQNTAEGEVEKLDAALFVWWSTEDSVQGSIPSALATVEMLAAVSAWWAYAIYFETFAHLWVSICVAPLLLLRSRQSIALATSLFNTYLRRIDESEEGDSAIRLVVGFLASSVGAVLISYLFAKYWLSGREGWALIWRGAMVGFLTLQLGRTFGVVISNIGWASKAGSLIAGIVATIAMVIAHDTIGSHAVWSVAAGLFAGVLFAPPASIWLGSAALRFAANGRYALTGFWHIPNNFVQTVFVMDMHHPAELMPGYHKEGLPLTSKAYFRSVILERRFSDKVIGMMYFLYLFVPVYFVSH